MNTEKVPSQHLRDALGAPNENDDSDGSSGTSRESGGIGAGRNAPGAPLVELTGLGEAVRKEIAETHTHYDGVVVDKFVVMPNHVHLIVLISGDGGTPGASVAPQKQARQSAVPLGGGGECPRLPRPMNTLIPRIVAMLKKKTNTAFGSDIWQRSFHDHIIRNESEYLRIWQYIDDNPALWADDRYFAPD